MLAVEDVYSSISYEYDDLDRLTIETQVLEGPNGDELDTVVLRHEHDLVGNRTSTQAEIDAIDDFFTNYEYDDRYRMTGIEQSGHAGGNAVAETPNEVFSAESANKVLQPS